jgi:hypothetical protein
MTARRLLLSVVALLLSVVASSAQGTDGQPRAELTDFLIIAIQPESDDAYKLVEVGETNLDEAKLKAALRALPFDFWGLTGRDHNEAAELAQCQAACKANGRCREVAYVRPTESRPLGVCHLKAMSSFGVMAPVDESGIERPVAKASDITVAGRETSGHLKLDAKGQHPTPVTLRFAVPVAAAKVFIRAAESTGQRTWASVEGFDTKGKLVDRAGTWISVGEMNFGHAVTLAGETDRYASIKITSREPGQLIVDGLEFSRTFVTPPVKREKPAEPAVERNPPQTASPPVEPAEPSAATPAPQPQAEPIPLPPELEPSDILPLPLPPRAVATDAPRDITIPVTPPEVPIAPAIETPPAVVPATPRPAPVRRGLPIWLAVGAIAAMIAGALLYTRNYNARTRARLAARVVSNGLDRQTVEIEDTGAPDASLHIVVRDRAAIASPSTRIKLVPHGAPA